MRERLLAGLLVLLCGMSRAWGLDVEVLPGQLSQQVTNPEKVTELKLTGKADATDLEFIGMKMTSLVTLNLGNLTIVECSGQLIGNVTFHQANAIPAGVFAGMKIKAVTLPQADGLKIGAGAFAGSALTGVVIPATVAELGDGCFAGCKDLKTATTNVKAMGVGVFSGCTSLLMATLNGLEAVPAGCFYNCKSLTKVDCQKITAIGERAFTGCLSLKDFIFEDGMTTIGREAFMNSGLEKVNLEKCAMLDSIGEWAFAEMPNLNEIKLGQARYIGPGFVFGCPELVKVNASESSSDVPDFAFSKTGIADAYHLFPPSAKTIGRYALSGVNGIETMTLPASLEKIGDRSMENMTGLTSIFAPGNVIPELGEDVWAGVDQGSVNLIVPDGLVESYREADQWCNFVILDMSTGTAPITTIFAELKARFEGENLIVYTGDVEISDLMLYNPSGQLLVSLEPHSDLTEVDTSGFGTRIFIVYATLTDGRTAALKLSK